MSSLAKLRELDVSFNELEPVLESLCFATSFVKLVISNNFADMRSLPRSIGNLEMLDMSTNQIHVLPESFRLLTRLRVYHFDQNPREMLPGHIAEKGAQAVVQYMADLVANKDVKKQPTKQKKSWSQICFFPNKRKWRWCRLCRNSARYKFSEHQQLLQEGMTKNVHATTAITSKTSRDPISDKDSVSVPYSSMTMVVTVRCGHCTGLLSFILIASFVPLHLFSSLKQDQVNNNKNQEVDTSKAMDRHHTTLSMLPSSEEDNDDDDDDEEDDGDNILQRRKEGHHQLITSSSKKKSGG